jgi:energy-coupling factor transporter ATP-binding protein EcfA2
MVYLNSFTILSREQEEKKLGAIRETCYTTLYPFNIFRYRNMTQLEFEPLTIFYGGNGSGKTTLLNIIAERLHLSREAVFNRSNFFEDYVRACRYEMAFGEIAPPGSRIITSDDVFDYLLDIRCINQGIDTERVKATPHNMVIG